MKHRSRIRLFLPVVGTAAAALLLAPAGAPAQEPSQEPALVRKPNTTLRMPQQPPQFGFTTRNAVSGLTFTDPVAIVSPPGETNRLFVVEQAGRIAVIPDLRAPSRVVFLDISTRVVPGGERGLLGLAFHPFYATNRQFFVFYSLNATTVASGLHQRIARFTTSAANPNPH